MTVKTQYIIEKYGDIIKEEVNVKDVDVLSQEVHITKLYVPVGSMLSQHFGKDTGKIIAASKAGQAEEVGGGRLRVRDGDQQWELSPEDYEVRYEGINEQTQTVEQWVMVELDLTMTDALRDEGVAREISRFLNQMRKNANYNVDDRVLCIYTTASDYLKAVLATHADMLKSEALLSDIQEGTWVGDIEETFENEGEICIIRLKR